MKVRVTPPPVTVSISNSCVQEIKNVVAALFEVFEPADGCRIEYDEDNRIKYLHLGYDVFQQIYASLQVELQRECRHIAEIPRIAENNFFDANIFTLNEKIEDFRNKVSALLSLLQDFREAERNYLQARLAISRSVMLNGREADNE